MTDLIIPNWHPLLVHFTVGLTVSSTLFLILSKVVQKKHVTIFETAGKWTLWLGAAITVLTVLAGIQAFNSVAHDDIAHKVMKVHRAWALGTAATIILVAVWVYKSKTISAAVIAASLALTGLVGVTGYLGAELVYRHGLGVMRLPDASGEGHDHGGDASHSHDSDHQEEAAGHDEDHDHAAAGVESDRHEPTAPAVIDGHSHSGMSAQDYAQHFQEALYSGNFESVAASFAADAVIFENGVREASLENYLEHHLKPEMPMLEAAQRKLLKQDVQEKANLAVVTTSATLSFMNNDKRYDFYSVETLGLVKVDGEWKVSHAHWSSRPIKK
ncbi:DUF2231 domain-containing protein [Kordiimonas lipolytica]|uniref:DUF2231 domain-containing protein n=1 Tax=Kordiimonas lipolytica TaxID=1662421 RepID=A0ABV8U6X4_9PROT|nr:DUF2231 domain-containing protein [Kordiimonas lipolytica]